MADFSERFLGRGVLGMSNALTDCLKKAIDQYLMARDDDQFHPMAGTALPPAGRSARMGVHAPSEDIMLPLKWDYSPEDFLDGCDHAAGVGPLGGVGLAPEVQKLSGFGTTGRNEGDVGRGRARSRIITVVIMLGTACVVTLSLDGGRLSRGPAALHENGGLFGCSLFLCPHSGECWKTAAQCPEGNPFSQRDGAFGRLVQCGDLLRGADLPQICKAPIVMLRRWGLSQGDGCSAFLCPRSGACVAAPHQCPEGNPFGNATSLYWAQAMAVSAGILGGKRAVPSEMGGTGVLQEGGPTDDGDGDQGTVSFRNIPTIKVPPAGGGGDSEGFAHRGPGANLHLHHQAALHRLNKIIRRSQEHGDVRGAPGSRSRGLR